MKKPSSKIREEIARLQEQLKQAETREAERIGRLALKAGLGDIEIEERALVTAFEELVVRFRKGSGRAKAGLRYEKRALLLGLLIDGASRIRTDEAERARLMAIGLKAFSDDPG